jgi:hypothetical protein
LPLMFLSNSSTFFLSVPFLFPEMSPPFTAYIAQIISIHLVCIPKPLQFSLLLCCNNLEYSS